MAESGNAITVEELQIRITAEYGDAIRQMLKMVEEVRKTLAVKLEPAAKAVDQAMDSMEPSVKHVAKSVKKSVDDIVVEGKTLDGIIDGVIQKTKKASKYTGAVGKVDPDTLKNIGRVNESYEKLNRILESTETSAVLQKTDAAVKNTAKSVQKIEPAVRSAGRAIQNSTKQVQIFGKEAEKASKKAQSGFKKLGTEILSMAKFNLIFSAISLAVSAVTDGLRNMAETSEDANRVLSSYMSSFTYLKNSIGAAIFPILEFLEPVVTTIVDLLAEGFNYLGMFLAALTGQKTYKKAVKTQNSLADSLNNTADAAKRAGNVLASFDELNVLNFDTGVIGEIQEAVSAFEEAEVPEWMKKIADFFGFAKNNGTGNGRNGMFDSRPVLEYAEALDKVDVASRHLERSWSRLKIPEWLPAPAFEPVTAPAIDMKSYFLPSLERYGLRIPAPEFLPATAPAIDMRLFEVSRILYGQPISAPVFEPVFAPVITLDLFEKSRILYGQPIPAPVFEPVVAPALDISTSYIPSFEILRTRTQLAFEEMRKNIFAWGSNIGTNLKTSMEYCVTTARQKFGEMAVRVGTALNTMSENVVIWGTNLMTNAKTTMEYIPGAVSSALTTAGQRVADFVNSTSQNIVTWGNNFIENAGKTMKGWYENFVSALSGAWKAFSDFCKSTGEKISDWWDGNKKWVVPTAVGVGLAAATVTAVVLSGGSAAAAIPALTPALAAVPAFASGAVITSPTLGLMGEYPSAASNPEIVTPQKLLYETVTSANAEQNTLLREQNNLLRQLLRKENSVVLAPSAALGRVNQRSQQMYEALAGGY